MVNFDTNRKFQAVNHDSTISTSNVDGVIAGVIGATVIAVWFFIVDLVQGRPLYTPTVLGTALFGGENGLTGRDPFHASWETTLMFTWAPSAPGTISASGKVHLCVPETAGRAA